jgi:glucose-6-phosphate dehydrogenase assembly protein OpcA
MPAAYKVLGQSNPSATTLTTLYTVPSSTSAVCSTLAVANTGSSQTTYRVAVRPAGASIATSQYLAYDVQIAGNDSVLLTLGLSLATTDVVSVYAGNANLAFSLFGSEIT